MTVAVADPMLPQRYRVTHAQRLLDDTVSLRLTPQDGELPSWQPGQFNMLYAFGVGESAISISGADDNGFEHTVRAVGAVSRAIAALQVGDSIGLRGPFGSAWPVTAAEGADVVFVAGGLGLAPLRPAIEAVLQQRERYGRVVLRVGARRPQDLLFPEALERWRLARDVDIDVSVDHADTQWRGHVGVVTTLIAGARFDPHESIAMVCGPDVMMRFCARSLHDEGVADDRIYLSMERNMKCAIGLCGHCQFGPSFICKDGPVMRYDTIADRLNVREL
ncbi:Ni/Fe hydrogenase subunit gamma [Sinimarinibacterium sp. CAU 1509]|uniref:FAD/NAD(P)-binding protein n=1 Tax=Sinimarinibacterium sp. CAU 1509 TaxID=2562283 RepID=UPI0010AB559C|nr:FAD/NAD(P)-binding protein [Sinimarinibacterium sp. CAU 1509]TJY59292.1 Ni/Fe hydrogenase subunit gamma [Sinimarinibacterium sp. CAU 1509]